MESAESTYLFLTRMENQKAVFGSEEWDNDIASGTCGKNLTWVLSGNGCLTISGKGKMDNYDSSLPPWNEWRNTITSVNITQGVGSIGRYAFPKCGNLKIVILNHFCQIGRNAFPKTICRSDFEPLRYRILGVLLTVFEVVVSIIGAIFGMFGFMFVYNILPLGLIVFAYIYLVLPLLTGFGVSEEAGFAVMLLIIFLFFFLRNKIIKQKKEK